MNDKTLTYKDAGVDITAGYKAVDLIKQHVRRTYTKNVLTDIGGFGGLFALNNSEFREPVLVAGTDGVGTKLMIAFMADKHDTIGEDCVAMCVNDVLCHGARPLLFLDYIATGKLKPEHVAQIVEGIANGCVKANTALIGGETAEMPGLYKSGEYDVAGFTVGIVEKSKIIDGTKVAKGDVIIGIESSGLHSNGFSLVRKVLFDVHNYKVSDYIPEFGDTLGSVLLTPTSIYVEAVYKLTQQYNIKGITHITGGGFYENIPRMIPDGFRAKINTNNYEHKPVFEFLQKLGNIETKEMYSTFNMGIGMVMITAPDEADTIVASLKQSGYKAYYLGEIEAGETGIELAF